MEEKKFSKFFVASLKRTAQNVYPLVRKRDKLQKQIAEAQEELNSINIQLDAYQAPIKEQTGGYTTDDLINREVINTGKTDKNGKPVKQTVFKLTYPDTVIPTTPPAGNAYDPANANYQAPEAEPEDDNDVPPMAEPENESAE